MSGWWLAWVEWGNHPHLNLPPIKGEEVLGADERVMQRSPSRGKGGEWIPAFAGMTKKGAGMTKKGPG